MNAPALVFMPPVGWGLRPIADYEIELRDQDQNVVPVTFTPDGAHHLVRPSRELQGAQLSVRYRDFCTSFPTTSTTTISLAASSPLPTTIGSAALREPIARYLGDHARCLPAGVSMVVDVRMSPELQAYRGVTRWQITYNGRTRSVEYGELQTGVDQAYVALEDTCGSSTETVGGPVTIAAHVAGATSDPPPLTLMVSARCPDFGSPKAPPRCPSVDAGLPDAAPVVDAGPPVAEPKGGAATSLAPAATRPRPPSGVRWRCCSVSSPDAAGAVDR